MSSENKKVDYTDQTRFPKVVTPIEESFKKSYKITIREMLGEIVDEMIKIKNK